ncbi:hypothetical protein [Dyella acidiphila]|uniref:Uncharacterized protein n=1 Tax=Dyella acidiphila TaxID=2775866 RepID=A0ABR9GCR1_9GAMM|nr:hypothetical protein [Dyella acidiphila]MBE1161830.1 hypothetical protein [Dyella acidiphila]
MPHLLMRLIANRTDLEHIAAHIRGLHGVQNIAQADDLVPQMGRQSPATVARPADAHPTLHSLDIQLDDDNALHAVRRAAQAACAQRGIEPEFIEDD